MMAREATVMIAIRFRVIRRMIDLVLKKGIREPLPGS
jgi:hypothetical protein